MQIATVDEWYELTRLFPEFRKVTGTALKDWGVMKSVIYIEARLKTSKNLLRILEFGHGFNPYIMARFQDRCEVWGADREQSLQYFDPTTWEERFQKEVAPFCQKVKFVRTLVGEKNTLLPENYFDVIVSVSVLEEMPVDAAGRIVTAASKLLRSGGTLIGSYDLLLSDYTRIATEYFWEHKKADLDLDLPQNGLIDWEKALIENPVSVMLWYQGSMPENRKYWGHHGSLFTVATKA
jgi:hypothetical protein